VTLLQYSAESVNSPHTRNPLESSSVARDISAPARGGSVTGGARDSGCPFLYQNSNNSNENLVDVPQFLLESALPHFNKFSAYHQKQTFCIAENCKKFIALVGIERVGFLTLTFADNVADNSEASRRWNSLKTGFFPKHYGAFMLVKERQKRGAWHYHVLVDCKVDVRTNFDFDLHAEISQLRKGGYRKNEAKIRPLEKVYYKKSPLPLRRLWSINQDVENFGFGRPDLWPLKKAEEAVSSYMSKYLSKHIGVRPEQDKGVRLVSYSKNFPRSTPKFQWNSDGSKEWRRKLAKFAEIVDIHSEDQLAVRYGPKWAHHLGFLIGIIDELSPNAVPEMAHNFTREFQRQKDIDHSENGTERPWIVPFNSKRTILQSGVLYSKCKGFEKTGEVEGLF